MSIDTIKISQIRSGSKFMSSLESACGDASVLNVAHTGAGAGDGIAEAIIRKLQRKSASSISYKAIELSKTNCDLMKQRFANIPFFTAINGTAIASGSYLSHLEVKNFYWDNDTDFKLRILDEVYPLRLEELNYISVRGFSSGALSGIVAGIDMMIIAGSEFTGEQEFDLAIEVDPIFFALWDTNSIRNYKNAQSLSAAESGYHLYSSGKEYGIEWKIFEKNGGGA